MSKQLIVQIESLGNFRNLVSKGGKPFTLAEAYVSLPNEMYPVKVDYFAKDQNAVLPNGKYECPLDLRVENNRLTIQLDTQKAVRISTPERVSPAQVASAARAAN